jgi:hypothetical protein
MSTAKQALKEASGFARLFKNLLEFEEQIEERARLRT